MSDPKRLIDPSSKSTGAMRELLRAARADVPHEERLEGIALRMGPLMGGVHGGHPAGPASSPSAGPSPVASPAAGPLGGAGAAAAGLKVASAVKVAALLVTLGTAAGAGVYAGSPLAGRAAARASIPVVVAPPRVAPPMVPAPSLPTPAETLAPADVLAIPEPSATASPVTVANGANTKPADGNDTEISLLEAAQDRLASSPALALAYAERHAQRYPRGALSQEREVIAIEALLRLHRTREAGQRAERFYRDFPDSAHRARIEALVNEGG